MGALLASTLLSLGYLLPVVVRAFAEPGSGPRHEAPAAVLVPLLVTAAAGLALGLAPDGLLPALSLARAVADSVTGR